MKVLSISTATNHLSVAVTENEQVIAEKAEQDQRNHSEHLDPLIAELLEQHNLTLKDIDRFAVAIGPGSYTGLRIGITTVKMFAKVLNKDLVGISTLQALAQGVSDATALIVPELDARNDNFFAGAYVIKAGQPTAVIADGHYPLEQLAALIKAYLQTHQLKQVIFVGSPIAAYQPQFSPLLGQVPFKQADASQNHIHASNIGRLALTRTPVDPDKMVPNYLRRTQAELDWHQKTGQPFGSDHDYVEEV